MQVPLIIATKCLQWGDKLGIAPPTCALNTILIIWHVW